MKIIQLVSICSSRFVIPAKAGIQIIQCTAPFPDCLTKAEGPWVYKRKRVTISIAEGCSSLLFVIPAKAGIHSPIPSDQSPRLETHRSKYFWR